MPRTEIEQAVTAFAAVPLLALSGLSPGGDAADDDTEVTMIVAPLSH